LLAKIECKSDIQFFGDNPEQLRDRAAAVEQSIKSVRTDADIQAATAPITRVLYSYANHVEQHKTFYVLNVDMNKFTPVFDKLAHSPGVTIKLVHDF
jgi:hypothetical protein